MRAIQKGAALVATALVLPIAGCGPSAEQRQAAAQDAIVSGATDRWPPELKNVFAPSPESKKPALVTFTATWCGPCKVLDAEIRSHERLKAEAAQWQSVTIDVDQHPAVARQFLVQGIPTILFVDANSKSVGRLDRYVSPEDLLTRMQTFRSRLSP